MSIDDEQEEEKEIMSDIEDVMMLSSSSSSSHHSSLAQEAEQFLAQREDVRMLEWTHEHAHFMKRLFQRTSVVYFTRLVSQRESMDSLVSNLYTLEEWQATQCIVPPKFYHRVGLETLMRATPLTWLLFLQTNRKQHWLPGLVSHQKGGGGGAGHEWTRSLLSQRALLQPLWAAYVYGTEKQSTRAKYCVGSNGYVAPIQGAIGGTSLTGGGATSSGLAASLKDDTSTETNLRFVHADDRYLDSKDKARLAEDAASMDKDRKYEFNWREFPNWSFDEFLKIQVPLQLEYGIKRFTHSSLWPLTFQTSIQCVDVARTNELNKILNSNKEWKPLHAETAYTCPMPIPESLFQPLLIAQPNPVHDAMSARQVFLAHLRSTMFHTADRALNRLFSQGLLEDNTEDREVVAAFPILSNARHKILKEQLRLCDRRMVLPYEWNSLQRQMFSSPLPRMADDGSTPAPSESVFFQSDELWSTSTLTHIYHSVRLMHGGLAHKPISSSSAATPTSPAIPATIFWIQAREHGLGVDVGYGPHILVSLYLAQICSLVDSSSLESSFKGSEMHEEGVDRAIHSSLDLSLLGFVSLFSSYCFGRASTPVVSRQDTATPHSPLVSDQFNQQQYQILIFLWVVVKQFIEHLPSHGRKGTAPFEEEEEEGNGVDVSTRLVRVSNLKLETHAKSTLWLKRRDTPSMSPPPSSLGFLPRFKLYCSSLIPNHTTQAASVSMYREWFQTRVDIPDLFLIKQTQMALERQQSSSSDSTTSLIRPNLSYMTTTVVTSAQPVESSLSLIATSASPFSSSSSSGGLLPIPKVYQESKYVLYGSHAALEMAAWWQTQFLFPIPAGRQLELTHERYVSCITVFLRTLHLASLNAFCSPIALHNGVPAPVLVSTPFQDPEVVDGWIALLLRLGWVLESTQNTAGMWSFQTDAVRVQCTSTVLQNAHDYKTQQVGYVWNPSLDSSHFLELIAALGATLLKPCVPHILPPLFGESVFSLKALNDQWQRVMLCYIEDGMQAFWNEALSVLIQILTTNAQKQLMASLPGHVGPPFDSFLVWEWKTQDLSHPVHSHLSILVQRALLQQCQLVSISRPDFWWTLHTPALPEEGSDVFPTFQLYCKSTSEGHSLLWLLKRLLWKTTRGCHPALYGNYTKMEQRFVLTKSVPDRPVVSLDMLVEYFQSVPASMFPSPSAQKQFQRYSVRDKRNASSSSSPSESSSASTTTAAVITLDSIHPSPQLAVQKWTLDQLCASTVRNLKSTLDEVLQNRDVTKVLSDASVWHSLCVQLVSMRYLSTEEEWISVLGGIASPLLTRLILLTQCVHDASNSMQAWWPHTQSWVVQGVLKTVLLEHQQQLRVCGSIHLPTQMLWTPLLSSGTKLSVFDWTESALILFGLLTDIDRRYGRLFTGGKHQCPNLWIDYRETLVHTCVKRLASHAVFVPQRICLVLSREQIWTKESFQTEFVPLDESAAFPALAMFDLVVVALEYLSQHNASSASSFLPSPSCSEPLKKKAPASTLSPSTATTSSSSITHSPNHGPDAPPKPRKRGKTGTAPHDGVEDVGGGAGGGCQPHSPSYRNETRVYKQDPTPWNQLFWNRIAFAPSLFSLSQAWETAGAPSSVATPSPLEMFHSCSGLSRRHTILMPLQFDAATNLSWIYAQPAFGWIHPNAEDTFLLRLSVRRWDALLQTLEFQPNAKVAQLRFVERFFTAQKRVTPELQTAWVMQTRKNPDYNPQAAAPNQQQQFLLEACSWYTAWMTIHLDPNNRYTGPFLKEMCGRIFSSSSLVDSVHGEDDAEWQFHQWFHSKWAENLEQEDSAAMDCLLRMVQSGMISLDANRFYEWLLFQSSNPLEYLAGRKEYRQYRKHRNETKVFTPDRSKKRKEPAPSVSSSSMPDSESVAEEQETGKEDDSISVKRMEEDQVGETKSSPEKSQAPKTEAGKLRDKTVTQVLSDLYFKDFLRILSAYDGNDELINIKTLFAKYSLYDPNLLSSASSSQHSQKEAGGGFDSRDKPAERRRGRPPMPKPPPSQPPAAPSPTPQTPQTPGSESSNNETMVYSNGSTITIPAHLLAKLNGTSAATASKPSTTDPASSPKNSSNDGIGGPAQFKDSPSMSNGGPQTFPSTHNNSILWEKGFQPKFYKCRSSADTLPALDMRKVSHWFCRVWFQLKLDPYHALLTKMNSRVTELQRNHDDLTPDSVHVFTSKLKKNEPISEILYEYAQLKHQIQLLEGWIDTVMRIRTITMPNLYLPPAKVKAGAAARPSYKDLQVTQTQLESESPWITSLGVYWALWKPHPEFRLHFANWVFKDQKFMLSKLLAVPERLEFPSMQETDAAFPKPAFWNKHMRKINQHAEKWLWVFPTAASLSTYDTALFSVFEQCQKSMKANSPYVVLSSTDNGLQLEHRTLNPVFRPSKPASFLFSDTVCHPHKSSSIVSSSSSLTDSAMDDGCISAPEPSDWRLQFERFLEEPQQIMLATRDALSFLPSAVADRYEHIFFVCSDQERKDSFATRYISSWLETYSSVWIARSRYVYCVSDLPLPESIQRSSASGFSHSQPCP